MVAHPSHTRTTPRLHLTRPQVPPLTFFHIFLTSKHFTNAPLHLPKAPPSSHLSPFFTSPSPTDTSPTDTSPTHLCTYGKQHPDPTSHLFSHLFHQQAFHPRTSALSAGTTQAQRKKHLPPFFTSPSPASISPSHLCT